MRLRLIRFGDVATTYGIISALDSANGETVVHRELLLEGYVLINAAGTLLVQGAQNVSNASPTTFHTGSSMELERIF
jgi:predicted metal-binding membrane protein